MVSRSSIYELSVHVKTRMGLEPFKVAKFDFEVAPNQLKFEQQVANRQAIIATRALRACQNSYRLRAI